MYWNRYVWYTKADGEVQQIYISQRSNAGSLMINFIMLMAWKVIVDAAAIMFKFPNKNRSRNVVITLEDS